MSPWRYRQRYECMNMYVHLHIFMYMYIPCTYMSRFMSVCKCMNIYVHVCTMFRHVCTVLPRWSESGFQPEMTTRSCSWPDFWCPRPKPTFRVKLTWKFDRDTGPGPRALQVASDRDRNSSSLFQWSSLKLTKYCNAHAHPVFLVLWNWRNIATRTRIRSF